MEKGTNFGYDFCDQTKRIKGSGSRMSNVSTKIIEALLKNESVNEVFRQELESALNQMFTIELDSFLNYGRYDPAGYNSGDSRNGYYRRILHTEYGDLNLLIPRDREGLFHQKTLAPYQRNSDTMDAAIIELYRHGITTREIVLYHPMLIQDRDSDIGRSRSAPSCSPAARRTVLHILRSCIPS